MAKRTNMEKEGTIYTLFDFEYGECYYFKEWEETGMSITISDDFTYQFGIYKDGRFHLLQRNYLPDITRHYYKR